MANEIQVENPGALNLYALVFDPATGLVRRQTDNTWVTYVAADANRDTYDFPLAQIGATRFWGANFPTGIAAGNWVVEIFQRTGTVPLNADPVFAPAFSFPWTGTAEVVLSGLATATELATLATYVDTEVAAIKAKTDALALDGSGRVTVGSVADNALTAAALAADAVTEVQSGLATATVVAAIKTKTDNLPSVTAGQASGLALVGSEMEIPGDTVDAIAEGVLDGAIPAPTAAPTNTYTLRSVLGWLLALNKFKRVQTSSTETLYAEDGTTAIATSTKTDSSGSFTRGRYT